MNLHSLLKTVGYKGEFIWAITVISSQESGAKPLCPGIRGLLQCASTTWCKSSYPLPGIKRCPLFGGSVCMGRSSGAKARCPLDGGVRYLECPLKEVPLYS